MDQLGWTNPIDSSIFASSSVTSRTTVYEFRCRNCGEEFRSEARLNRHIESEHEWDQPRIWINGFLQVHDEIQVRVKTEPKDWTFTRVSAVRINGANLAITPEQAAIQLALESENTIDRYVDVELERNASNSKIELRHHRIRFAVEDEATMSEIDDYMESQLVNRDVIWTSKMVEKFGDKFRGINRSKPYFEGIFEYALGRMKRDTQEAKEPTFVAHFNNASQSLKYFDRSKPKAIRFLMAFQRNNFDLSLSLCDSARLRALTETLALAFDGNEAHFDEKRRRDMLRLSSRSSPTQFEFDLMQLCDERTWQTLCDCFVCFAGVGGADGFVEEDSYQELSDSLKVAVAKTSFLIREKRIEQAKSIARKWQNNPTALNWVNCVLNL